MALLVYHIDADAAVNRLSRPPSDFLSRIAQDRVCCFLPQEGLNTARANNDGGGAILALDEASKG